MRRLRRRFRTQTLAALAVLGLMLLVELAEWVVGVVR